MAPSDLQPHTRWAGLRPGDPVVVTGTRMRGASWSFVAQVANKETGEVWVEVVGAARAIGPSARFAPTRSTRHPPSPGRDPSLADAPGLPLG